jgi:hypothetical protein
MTGLMMLLVNAVTTAVNALPTTTATASFTTFPRIRKSLKPLSTAPFLPDLQERVVSRCRTGHALFWLLTAA